ncbi:MAG: nucleotidyltransferase domain-containing protein [Methylobacterium sp.]|uniref:nucleotidyltransferase family protein n=1 Tax=unclassified Methylobacterium TaxID=2615210 RepID=UPI0006FD6645|nr:MULTISPECIES: nucleotidyltransferase domain-containing protein [unclassified Methylobacterium]KQP10560.1 DNA polymerase III subunit beta [Methylobacterium sp. Leaf99]MDO9426435.1 nucleotidyltransferase domain-containing protein [Methylobacterium sp.]TXM79076.1 nucleotidyltransferase [Methylobacterium sp. WL69]
MEREAAIEILRAHEGALRARGIRHAALFGSTARGEAHADSDVDIVIDLDEALKLDVYAYVGLCHFIADLFPVSVDVANRKTLKDRVRTRIERDAIPVF